MKKKIFVIVWINEEGQRLYFEHEECGLLDPTTKTTIREARGYFSPDVKDARKFGDRWQAEFISSSYSGAHVEKITDGERLK